MSLETDKIKARLDTLQTDMQKLSASIQDLEKKKLEAIAQLNAFQGAAQQCQMFLTEINNEKASSDNPGDMGTLPDAPDDKYETNQEKDDSEAPM